MINLNNCTLKRHKIFVEIPVLLVYFALTFSDSVTASFITYRTCYVIAGYRESDCGSLIGEVSPNRSSALLDRKVQPSAIVITSTISIIQGLIPPLLCFFIGPWSNKYGRKPIMLYSTFALIIQYATMIFISAVPHMSPWYVLLSQLLLCVSGGVPAFVAAIFTYLTDTVAENERGLRIAFLEAVRSCGVLIGAATGIVTLKASGYVAVYSISVVVLVLGWSFIWLLVPESIQVTETENKLPKFFDFVSLVNTAKIAFKSRESNARTLLLTLLSVIIFYTIATSGSGSVSSLYFQNRFHWNLTNTINYNIVISVTTIIGGIICVYVLYEKLKCGELIAIVAGLVSLIAGSFVLAVAATTSIIHLGACMQCFGPALLSMVKSFLSKLVPHEEASIVFAVVGSLETVFTLVGASLFAVIYHSTISSNPATFVFVAAGMYLFQLVSISTLIFIQKCRNPMTFSRIHDEDY